TVRSENAFVFILTHALPPALGNALIWMVMGAMWFCGLSSITSNSRMLFAFARDGGLPFAREVARVSPRFKSPYIAVWISVAAAFVVAASASAYSAIVALSTIALYASYGLPILSAFRARLSGRELRRGPWNLGAWSNAVNAVALAWIGVITVL